MTTAASLCTGYLGLDLAAETVLGPLEHAWISEIDKDALTVLAARLPGVRNLGDLTRVAWSTVEPVDVLTAGYPCQPFSQAGKRKGEHDDRHLWPYICDAVSALRPGLVLLENVAGHLSLGGPAVIASLAALRYDARWLVVRAADVGACHRRARWFCVAADINGGGFDRWADLRANTNSAGFGVEQRVESGLGSWRDVDGLRTVDTSADTTGSRSTWRQDARAGGGDADTNGRGRVEFERGHPGDVPEATSQGPQRDTGRSLQYGEPAPIDWAAYQPAIRRHERACGRLAPPPTNAKGQLDARFVEWMMMLPEGWVTDVITRRTPALKLLGNGVVPPQAAYAYSLALGLVA